MMVQVAARNCVKTRMSSQPLNPTGIRKSKLTTTHMMPNSRRPARDRASLIAKSSDAEFPDCLSLVIALPFVSLHPFSTQHLGDRAQAGRRAHSQTCIETSRHRSFARVDADQSSSELTDDTLAEISNRWNRAARAQFHHHRTADR